MYTDNCIWNDRFAEHGRLDKEGNVIIHGMDASAKESGRVRELAHDARDILDDLEYQFKVKTKLNSNDISYLFVAAALQVFRQYILTPFSKREPHIDAGADARQKEEKIFSYIKGDSASNRFYYASRDQIMASGVPYDVIRGSKQFSLKLSGNNHRIKTLGHDPLLGYIFGTSNILTSTLTDTSFQSFHVKNGMIQCNAETFKMIDAVVDRSLHDPVSLMTAVIKQHLHIKSDVFSKAGIPIPIISSLNSGLAEKLTRSGFDYGNLITAGSQASYAMLINILIGSIYNLVNAGSIEDDKDFLEVKCRKIITYSNAIASSSNVIAMLMMQVLGRGDAVRYLDIGGIIVTLYQIFNNKKIIREIKREFIYGSFDKMIRGEIK